MGRGRRAIPCGRPQRRTRASAGRTRPAPCGSPETRPPAGPPSGPSPRLSCTRRSREPARTEAQDRLNSERDELTHTHTHTHTPTSGLKTSDAMVMPSERRWLVVLALFRAIIAWRARRLYLMGTSPHLVDMTSESCPRHQRCRSPTDQSRSGSRLHSHVHLYCTLDY